MRTNQMKTSSSTSENSEQHLEDRLPDDILEQTTVLGDPDDDEEPAKFEHFHFVVDKGQKPLRVDKYLVSLMSGISRNRVQDAALVDCIVVNDHPVKANYKVRPYDDISVMLDYPKTDFFITPQDLPLDIVYEDEAVMVVNKPPDMVVHPGFGNYDGTLLNALAWYFRDQPKYDVNDAHIGLVHRIDKDTSGLLLIAKMPIAKSFLANQFFHKTAERTYNAVVWGCPDPAEGTIDGALARDPTNRLCFTVMSEEDHPAAKHAVTHYKVLESYAHVSLIECKLETGRTHQIRVHLKHIGHPLFNDERYGGSKVLRGVRTSKYKQFIANCFKACPRQALHAKTLGFEHPLTHEWMQFNSELPADIKALISKWEIYTKAIKE